MDLHIAAEFSDVPGPRSRQEGEWSGEEFRDKLLLPKFREAEKTGDKLLVDLDGGCGYATSFLEEAFGGLARVYSPERVLKVLARVYHVEPQNTDKFFCFIDIEKTVCMT